MNTSSKLIEEAVDQVASLPGVGRKTALRYILELLKRDPEEVKRFTDAISEMREKISYCEKCFNIADAKLCSICSNSGRNREIICVVEDMRDIMALESTHQYTGMYHVLGGKISPMDGVGPSDLNISELIERIRDEGAREVILALSATMEGDTTSYFIFKKIQPLGCTVTTLSRGVAIGDELEYADEVTLGRSIVNRTPYENSIA